MAALTYTMTPDDLKNLIRGKHSFPIWLKGGLDAAKVNFVIGMSEPHDPRESSTRCLTSVVIEIPVT